MRLNFDMFLITFVFQLPLELMETVGSKFYCVQHTKEGFQNALFDDSEYKEVTILKITFHFVGGSVGLWICRSEQSI